MYFLFYFTHICGIYIFYVKKLWSILIPYKVNMYFFQIWNTLHKIHYILNTLKPTSFQLNISLTNLFFTISTVKVLTANHITGHSQSAAQLCIKQLYVSGVFITEQGTEKVYHKHGSNCYYFLLLDPNCLHTY